MTRTPPRPSRHSARPARRAVLLASVAVILSGTPLSAQAPEHQQDAERAYARGRRAEAAAAYAAHAAACAQTDGTDDSAALAAATAATLAVVLHMQAPQDTELPDRLLALRTSPLAQSDPSFADHLGLVTLDALRQRGDDRAPSMARELGFVDDVWICGPLENERGSGFQREFEAELGFDPAATFPGKQRPVAWRRLQGAAPTGLLELGAVLRPAEQVACIVAFSVRAERATTAALHLGTSGSFVVRVGGARVAGRDVDRAFRPEQDVVALPLQPGDNLVTVKLCHQDNGKFATSLRLSALGGGPLVDCMPSGDPAGMATAPPGAAPASALPTPRQAALWRITAEDARGEDALMLGTLLNLRQPDEEGQRRDRMLAERAVTDLPDSTMARLLLARTRSRSAKVAAELDDNARRSDYEAVLAMDPEHVVAMLDLGNLLLDNVWLRADAAALARRALALEPDCVNALVLLCRTQHMRGNAELGTATALPVLAQPIDDSLRLWMASRLRQAGLPQQATAQIEQLTGSGSADILVAVADALLDRGRRDEALQVLQRARRCEPLERRVFAMRERLSEAEGRFEDAANELSAWLQLCPDDDDALVELSKLYGRMDRRDDQVELLRTALTINPNRRDDQRYLEYLASETAAFYAAHQLDAAPLLTVSTPAAAIAGKDPLFHLLRQTVVEAHRNGTTSSYVHLTTRVLTEAGARSLAQYRLPYYRSEQRARLLSCVIHKADGTLERPRLTGSSVALPALRPGDTIDIEGRIDDLSPSFFGDYFGLQHFMPPPDGTAVHRSELVVIAAPGRDYRYQLSGGAPEPVVTRAEDGNTVYAFAMRDLPRDVPEPRRPGAKERLPLVRFTTFRDWDAFTGWYWNLIRNQIESTPAMRAKVQELCAGCTTDEERIAALYRFVTTDVRYEAWEFGVHGYKPYSTAVIFDRRHGDCKDKALLLCALLREVDLQAHPVLIFADPRRTLDDLTLPMVQHFNHCIAWIPPQKGLPGRFLDGTATWHPPDLVPDMDQGANVLVVDDERALLAEVPYVTPAENSMTVAFEVELRPDGGADVRQVQQPRGNAAVELRAAMATEPARRREQLERSLVALFGPVAIQRVDASDPMDLLQPVTLTCDVDVPTIGQRDNGQWQLPSTFGDDPLQSLTTEPERQTPLLLGVPRGDRRVVRYRLPPAWRPPALPDDCHVEAPFGTFSMQWRRDGDQVEVERALDMTTSRIAPGDYAAFRDFVSEVRRADARVLVASRQENNR